MIQAIIDHQLDKAEKDLGVPINEMRWVAKVSRSALRAWSTVQSWAHFREALPAQAFYISKIAAYRVEDCGSCMQIAINYAKKGGVPVRLIQAALDRNLSELGPELAMVYLFAERQAKGQDDPDAREKIRAKYGDKALIDLAFSIVGSRAFPTFKRVLGYAVRVQDVTLQI